MSKAIFELLSQLNSEIESKLNDVKVPGAVKAYIFGGCAVHILTNARGSNDLDVEIEATTQLDIGSVVIELNDVYFNDPIEGDMQLILDDTFQIGITPVVSPDYKERAIPLCDGKQVLQVYLVNPVDIAISKLSRCAVNDVKDIVEIYKNKRFTLEEFSQACKEALEYTATPDSLRKNIDHVIMTLSSI
ncbi:DUF6036 family nucleotidyltransferase [Thalassotalea sp. ND16A]|uniref:DUF6036 family nucleotidyltransferase n=1 Tax=Thalassotalea sp. ND16A TaxID=1535422 RepID=UPI00190F7890|nr:DUF6036 family nucleotidyltransferase [Thalassotalea sp. ND16A]